MASSMASMAVRRAAAFNRVLSPSSASQAASLVHRRGLAGAADHHGPPKVNFWQEPMSPSIWKEEHLMPRIISTVSSSLSSEHFTFNWVKQFFLNGSNSPPTWAALVGGFSLAVSLTLSTFLLFEHLSTYKKPEEQKFLIGVLLMVPCYAVESFVSLMSPAISVYVEILRDGYESFAMYCFGRYLIACLGGEDRTIRFMQREGRAGKRAPLLDHGHEKGIIKHPFPMNYLFKPWKLGNWVYRVFKFGIVQYMIIKTFTAILAVILEAFHAYCEGDFKWNCGYPYMAVVINFSQSWAFYCLIQFYTITKEELSHIKPLYKFVTFKSIVFLTWWQGVAIALLYSLHLFRGPVAQALQFKSSIQDFIICIEMGIASMVHLYVFPAKPYKLMAECFSGAVSVLGDYVSAECPIDPDEVRDSERPTKLRLPQPDIDDARSGMNIKESVRDVVIGGGEYIVNDVKFTVTHAVEPVEKGITKFNEKLHKISQNIKKYNEDKTTKDDSCIATTSPTRRVIRGIDDPLLNVSGCDTETSRKKSQLWKAGYTSESGGENRRFSGFLVRGNRWVTKD